MVKPQDDIASNWKYASFRIRFVADLLDGLFILAVAFPIYWLVDRRFISSETLTFSRNGEELGISDVVVFALIFYNLIYLVGAKGYSWGRQVFGLRVVGYSGENIGFWRSFGRNLFAGFISSLFYLGFLWVIWDQHKQAWHDKVFRTYVLKKDI
jgi:uncharacterized RDD family membrane protein YckC